MNWNEIVERQAKEYADHINSVKASREQLMADKETILTTAKCSEAELPASLKDMLQRNAETWEKEYGMYGNRFKEMRVNHQRELKKFFEKEALAQDIAKGQGNAKEKSKDKSAGR